MNRRWRGSSIRELRQLIVFWGSIDDGAKSGADKRAWQQQVRADLARRDTAVLDAFASRWQTRYDEANATRATVTGRANSLLLFVGVITAGAGLVSGTADEAPAPILVLLLFLGVLLLYAALAAAVLAVRAQRVQHWDSPRIELSDATDERSIKLAFAVEVFVAAEQNRARLRGPVAFLRDAQAYAIGGLVLLALLVAVSTSVAVASNVSRPDGPDSPAPSQRDAQQSAPPEST